jgi:hypothetical protein
MFSTVGARGLQRSARLGRRELRLRGARRSRAERHRRISGRILTVTTREQTVIALWALFVLGAVGLAVVATPLWFAVAGLAAAALFSWARQRLSADAEPGS